MDSYITQLNRIYQTPPSIGSLQWCKVPVVNRSISELENQQSASFEQLVPTLIECFAVILGGYLVGRFGLISGSEIKGLNVFTSNISLPALIFLNLATLKLGDVDWWFITSVFLGKMVVFLGVVLVTIIVRRPVDLALAGIYAIFVSHSNDFGLAYPLVASLYGAKQPTFAGYLYLIAPISLMIVNPIGFVLMEAQKVRDQSAGRCPQSLENQDGKQCSNVASYDSDQQPIEKQSFARKIILVFFGVLTNPNVFVTILGLGANFIFKGQLPDIVYGILKVFGSAFSSSVLFLLGLRVVGATGHVLNSGLLLPGSLLIVKMLVTPLVTRAWVTLLCSDSKDLEDFENYGFLYGLVPSGPVVLLFASQYGLQTEMMATTLVICTCLFGPIMFVFAKIVTFNVEDIVDYSVQLKETLFWVSIIGFMASVWVAVLFLVSGKWRRSPYIITTCLVLSQAVMSIGVIFWASSWSSEPWATYIEIATITGGQLSTRLWTAVLAVTLVALQFLPEEVIRKTQPYILTIGIGLPISATIALLVTVASKHTRLSIVNNELPLFLYGQNEALAAIVVLSVCLGVTLTSLLTFIRRAQHVFLSPDEKSQSPTQSSTQCTSLSTSTDSTSQFVIPKIYVTNNDVAVYRKSSRSNKGDCVIYVDAGTVENVVGSSDQARDTLPFTVKGDDIPLPNEIAISIKTNNSNEKKWSFGTLVFHRTERSMSSRDLLQETDSSLGSPSVDCVPVSPADADEDSELTGDLRVRSHVIVLVLLSISMIVGLTVSTWKTIVSVPSGVMVAVEFLDSVLTFGQGIFVFAVFGLNSNAFTRYLLKRIRNLPRRCSTALPQVLSLRQRRGSTSSN